MKRLFDKKTRNLLHQAFNQADERVRDDYSQGYIVDENDYTSNLCMEVRKMLSNSSFPHVTLHSQKLPPSQERQYGCDACLILIDHNLNRGKICMFEAKANTSRWDYLDKKKQFSHFSTQLARQQLALSKGFAVWEQFYTKAPNGVRVGNRNATGSTCISGFNARRHNGKHPNNIVWTDSDIDTLALQQRAKYSSMGSLVERVCECVQGKPKNIDFIKQFLQENLKVNNLLIVQSGSKYQINDIVQAVPISVSSGPEA
ncbi:hypothetical protein ABXV23_25925 [Vibrio owensii]|uniref:hypothetical protein n=1 Tax=Vibrio owensii TaxID=696485 RepID=UPI0033976F45